MADIQAYLDAIENAVYGEDVRGSIHDAIKIINEVGEVVITAGTAVTSPSSSTEGFFENSLYFNTNTNDLWQCNGSGWTLLGNLKGDQGDQGNPGQAATIAVGTVTKGDNASVVNSGTASAAVFDFVLPKGDPGPAGVNTWGSITGDIDDQTDLKNALGDVYAQSEELVDRTVGWVCNNLFDIEAVEMGKDIYGEAAANAALFTLNCKPSTRYYLSVHGTNNLQVSYNTTALGPTEVLIASFPYDFSTTEYDTYIKICFTKSGLTKSDIEALKFMLSEVANAPYSEYHPPVSEWGYTREEANVLGAKNWYSSNNGRIVTENGATYELSSTGVRVYTTANKSYGNIQIPQILNKNTAFIVTGALDWVSGVARMQVRGSNDGSTWTAIAESSDWTSDRNVELSFNSGNYNYYHLRVWCTRDTAEIGDITLSNLMIRLASDPDDTYAPPAMTNLELTQEHVVYDDVVTSEYTLDANYKHVRKIGKLVICDVRLTGVTADANALLFLVPEGFRPYKGVKIRTFNDQAGFFGTNGYFSIGQALNNGECTLHAVWFTS